MKNHQNCGNCTSTEIVSINIDHEAVAEMLIEACWKQLEPSPEQLSVFLRAEATGADDPPQVHQLRTARRVHADAAFEQLSLLGDLVAEYERSPHGESLLRGFREALLLDIQTFAMTALSKRTGLFRPTAYPGVLAEAIVRPIKSRLKLLLDVGRGGARLQDQRDPAQIHEFVTRAEQLRPQWLRARKVEELPALDLLSTAHQKRMKAAFWKGLKPLHLALLQAAAEMGLWEPSRNTLPHENLAKIRLAYKKST
jgi:hypothetical protein